jgi:small neutral amino acid transporter SnatA (MarC family)
MDFLLHAACMVAALVILAASFIYIISPRRGRELLQRLLIGILSLLICAAILEQTLRRFLAWDLPTIAVLPGLSVAAYAIVKLRRKKPRSAQGHGRERTPVVAHVPEA